MCLNVRKLLQCKTSYITAAISYFWFCNAMWSSLFIIDFMIFTQPLKCEDQYSFILAARKLIEAELHEAALICTDSHGHCSSTQAHVALIQARQLKITRLPNLYQEETAKRQTSCHALHQQGHICASEGPNHTQPFCTTVRKFTSRCKLENQARNQLPIWDLFGEGAATQELMAMGRVWKKGTVCHHRRVGSLNRATEHDLRTKHVCYL